MAVSSPTRTPRGLWRSATRRILVLLASTWRRSRSTLRSIRRANSNKTQSVDCHGYVNPLELVLDTSKKEDSGGRGGRSSSGGPLEPLLGPLAAAAAMQQQHHPASFQGGPSSVAGRRTAATSPGGAAAGGRAMPSPPLPPAPQSAPPTTTAASTDAGRKQLSRTPTQPPPGAIEYVVKASDTLAGIAARFECTPGELTTMNRLTSRLIFPGQTLYIPVKEQESQAADAADAPEHARLENDKASAGHHGTGAGPPLPGERPSSPRATATPPDSPVAFVEQQRPGGSSTEHIESAEPENKACCLLSNYENMDMFLKISSRHITDGQGVVTGTLLVTPNNVMFIPNVSDALVMDRGSECYEVTAPMDMVVAAALYNDITHMRLRDTADLASGVQLEEPYRPADYQPPPKDHAAEKTSEPAKSSQECATEVPPVLSTQDAKQSLVSEEVQLEQLAAGVAPVPEANEKSGKALTEVVKDDRAGDKLAAKDVAALTNVQDKLPTDKAVQNKVIGTEESTAAKMKDRQNAEEYLFKPIEKASESPPTLRREADSAGRREKAFTPPPPSSGGKSLPEPARWSRMLSPTLKLDSTSDVPAPEPRSAASTESITLRMREWASAEGGISSDRAQESAHERVLKRLSNPMESISSYTHSISKMIASSPKSLADFVRGADEPVPSTPPPQLPTQQPAADEKRPSSRAENANVWLKNMVEEKPELFAAFEKLVPRLAQSSEATLLYLCLRMGRPLHKKVQCSATASSKRRIRPQYWFGIPRNRADELYYFLEKWAPSIYGDVHRVDMASRGFEQLPEPADEEEAERLTGLSHVTGTTSGTEEGRDTSDVSGSSKGHHGSKKGHGGALRFFKLFDSGTAPHEATAASPDDWEVVSMSETPRELALDLADLPLPELLDSTEIFTEAHRREVCRKPYLSYQTVFLSTVHFTRRFLRSCSVVVQSTLSLELAYLLSKPSAVTANEEVFGVLTSCSLRMSDHFYGTGESFLFTFHPEFKLYKWTGENGYFIKGNADSLAFGAGDLSYGSLHRVAMDLSKLRKPDLVMLCEEMGIEVATLRRKPLLIQALEDSGADEEELSECWELIQERMKRESEDKERETLQIVEAKCASSVREENAEIQADARLSMRDLLQPYKMKTDADDYNKIKAALLKKFRLSAEAFRRRFRDAQKTTSETFQEFAFNMKADLVEWLKGEGVYEDRDKVVDLICLEQFYGSIDEEMRLWIQDRPGERNIERAAELADEYTRFVPPSTKGPMGSGERDLQLWMVPEQRHCSPYVTSSGGGRAVITGKGRMAASRSCAVGVLHGRERPPVRCLERSSRCCRTQSASSDGRGTGGAFPTSYKKEGVGSARRCWVFRLLAHGGQFGLWLDGDLFHGRSSRCKTYENDVLSTREDFVVKALEAWGFV
ncbi:hypothetical protein HPB50_003343 [Hyalomma asiaticum]|uniref:Uncharacterized protein n=1 Tax=Hyalomma asiaticum TaxID=266040 RepID=A0ACB7SMD3_HYAAI|nr:hypothetical protein HPB50_003343 [Hyalomma asiaticum]